MSRTIINIVLRFDDPSPTSDHALEREIFTIFGDLGIPATVGVVPFGIGTDGRVPLTRDNVPHLVAAHTKGIIEVAQHGYAHEHLTTTPKGSPSEFWGVPTEEQGRRINAGNDQLIHAFGNPVCGFIPPWNTYDNTTLRHLATRGYAYLSGCVATPPRRISPCCFVPRTCDIHQMRQAYAEALRHRCLSSTIVVIMHHYDFLECARTPGKLSLAVFRETLHWLKQQPRARFITLQHLAENLGPAASHAALRRNFRKEQLHWRLQCLLPRALLMTHPLWMYLKLTTQRRSSP